MPCSDRLLLTLLTAGLLTPTVAHAGDPPAPTPEAAAPAVAAPAPAPKAEVAAPAPAPGIAAPTPTAAAPAPAPAVAAPTPTPAAPAAAAPTPAVATSAPTAAAPAPEAEATAEISPFPEPSGASTTAASPAAVVDAPAPVAPPADPYVHVPFDIGVFPSLSINGAHRNQKIRNTISVALGWTRTDRLEGAAGALGATIVDEDAHGITMALATNITRGEHQGIQATSGYNHAGALRGIQFGIINHVDQARGVQAGLVNVSRGRVRGVQLGLINYAEEADASFALIPVTKKGGIRPEVWTSDNAAINVGLRLPANYTYAFFAGGIHPIARRQPPVVAQGEASRERTDGMALMAGMGFGGHLPVGDELALDGDLSAWVVTSGLRATPPLANLAMLRAMLAWQVRPHLAVWGGPTVNVMVDRSDDRVPRPGYGWVTGSSYEVEGIRIRWWPGFAAGLRF